MTSRGFTTNNVGPPGPQGPTGPAGPPGPSGADGNPIGTIIIWSGSSSQAPDGPYLLCDGSELSRIAYADLFVVIGTTYGDGDGANTFNLPNIKGRLVAGHDAEGDAYHDIGRLGGSETHMLSADELPLHTHMAVTTINDPGHNHTQNAHTHANTINDPGHNHSTNQSRHTSSGNQFATGSNPPSHINNAFTNPTLTGITINNADATATNNPNQTGITADTVVGENVTHNTSFSLLQPYIVMRYYIKYKASLDDTGPTSDTPDGYYLFDDFSFMRSLNWVLVGNMSSQPSSYGHYGVMTLSTSATENSVSSCSCGETGIAFGNVAYNRWLLMPFSNGHVDNVQARIGLSDATSGTPSIGAWFEYDGDNSHDWSCVVNGVVVNSFVGVGSCSGNWIWLKIVNTGNGNCDFEIHNKSMATSWTYEYMGGGINPAGVVHYAANIRTSDNNAKSMVIDFFDTRTQFPNRLN